MKKNPRPILATLMTCSALALVVGGDTPARTRAQASSKAGRGQQTHILVGPDILASRDGDFAHLEMMVAASPRNASDLLAASIVFASPEGAVGVRPYVSHDGGFRWNDASPPGQSESVGADPQVAYGISGTAYFMYMAMPDTSAPPLLLFYRSGDAGKTWEKPALLGASSDAYDHPQLALDQSLGRFAGRVYVSVLGGAKYPEYRIGVFRSDDDGRSFVGPVPAASGGGKIGISNSNLMVLADGALVVPYCDFSYDQTKQHGTEQSHCFSVISNDGGVSFSSPRPVGMRTTSKDSPRLGTFPQFVADSTSGKYKDRLFAVWDDFRNGRTKVAFSYSADRGVTWSSSTLDAAAPENAIQFQPAIAVNKDGVVGVIWFDTRNLPDDDYNVYFAASEDGGESFLPSIKLNTEVSHRKGAGNMRISPTTWKPPAVMSTGKDTSARITMLSPMSRYAAGGDYIGLAADLDGTFHPLWPDSRSGTFQVYTTQVRLQRAASISGADPTLAACPASRVEITDDVSLISDPTKFVPDKREAHLPIRLKNNSKQPIYYPIVVQVDGFGSGFGELAKEFAPIILNASNGRQAVGAVFDYSELLGNSDLLSPGAETGAFIWKLRLSPGDLIPDLHFRVFGSRPASNCNHDAKPGTE